MRELCVYNLIYMYIFSYSIMPIIYHVRLEMLRSLSVKVSVPCSESCAASTLLESCLGLSLMDSSQRMQDKELVINCCDYNQCAQRNY